MTLHKHRLLFAGILFLTFVLTTPFAVQAREWNYKIDEMDTDSMIDSAATTAYIDTVQQEIRLPLVSAPNIISFAKEEGTFDYAVMTGTGLKYFMFDGEKMVENTLLAVSVTNPVGFVMLDGFPDVGILSRDKYTAFTFSGSGMSEIPGLSLQGLAGAVSVTMMDDLHVILEGGEAGAYGFTGSELVKINELGITSLTNPVAVSGLNSYELAVAEKNAVKWYGFDGSGMVQIPFLNIAGLNNVKSLAIQENRATVVDENQVKTFVFDGAGMSQSAALSVVSGLSRPSAVAIRPDSYDMLIVDGENVDYYSYDGAGMVKNPALSVVVEGILQGDSYISSAAVVSKAFARDADMLRVRASHILPKGTAVEWSVSNDEGGTWIKTFRVKNDTGLETAEYTADNGLTWTTIYGEMIGETYYSPVDKVSPFFDLKEIWGEFEGVSGSLAWKAELSTANNQETPRIIYQNGKGVVLEANMKPLKPVLDDTTQAGWYYTTAPTFTWSFSDPDDDEQSSFNFIIRNASGDIIWTEEITGQAGETQEYTLPTLTRYEESDMEGGLLWSSGGYSFTAEVTVYDEYSGESEASETLAFKVLAFERPRLESIISPPQEKLYISEVSSIEQLPIAKAGTKVTFLIDAVGPLELTSVDLEYPYLSTQAETGTKEASRTNGTNKTIRQEFWTEAAITEVPDGTIIHLRAVGTGTEGGTTRFYTTGGTGKGTFDYSVGLIKTQGTVYEDWQVVLQGSSK